jgi:hypothetical protein
MGDGIMLTQDDLTAIQETVQRVDEARREDLKCSFTKKLSCGEAKIYHMGQYNSTIRVDIKIKE